MTSPNLPPALTGSLASLLESAKRAPLRCAHEAMSALYRKGGHTRDAVPDAAAALAYAVARMPATYAACVRAFDLVAQRKPGLAPMTLLDLGAGPGTAALAAKAVWPALSRAHLVEPNPALSILSRSLLASVVEIDATSDALDIRSGSFPPSDLVTLSYVLAEQPEEDVPTLIARIAASVSRLIVIVEPGTPAGYARILRARDALIAAGLRIVAPCPHDRPCPLAKGDWCHFAVRLQRTAAHMNLKAARVPFEDEKFSFIAAMRGAPQPASARVVAPPIVEKGFVELKLCGEEGVASTRIRRRDAAAYKMAKALAWGDEADALAEPDGS